jgi:gamma-butyrobetaine dioxygenase
MMHNNAKNYEIYAVLQDKKQLVVHWSDGYKSTFHYIWLRDNCYCSACGDPRLGKKRFRLIDVPADVQPQSVHCENGNALEITWEPDEHRSVYDAQWLRMHCYSATKREPRQPILWDSHIVNHLPQTTYEEIRNGDAGRLLMLEHVRDYGICFVRNVPPQTGKLESVAESLGPIMESHYGRVFDIVVTPDENQKSVANSRYNLIPHTDDPYQDIPPGIIFFHCLKANDDGSGQSLFVDGFQIAEVLRREKPSAFDLLCHYEVSFHKQYDEQIDIQASSPVISLDPRGNLRGVRISNLFAAPFELPEELVEPFYAAYKKLMQLYTAPKYLLKVALRPGDMVIFDNHRILHGRTEIGMQQQRHLRWCSMQRDYLHRSLQILARRLGY